MGGDAYFETYTCIFRFFIFYKFCPVNERAKYCSLIISPLPILPTVGKSYRIILF